MEWSTAAPASIHAPENPAPLAVAASAPNSTFQVSLHFVQAPQARGVRRVDGQPYLRVVFDARTARPVSFNREARRIVGGLRSPGAPVEQLLEVMICRRTDGREVALDEFPLARVLSSGETVRAEEVELSVPDGRSVTNLVNATPIRAEDGTIETVVVTPAGPGAAGGT